MLWGYFDESFKDDKKTGHHELLSIGGALVTFDIWKQLSRQWDEVLKDNQVSMSHMADLKAGEGEFKGWKSERCDSFLESLLKIVNHYDEIRFFSISRHMVKSKRSVRDTYAKGLEKVIHFAGDDARRIDERVHLVFARHDEVKSHRIGSYCEKIMIALPSIRGYTVTDPLDCAPLQIADMAAYAASHLDVDRQLYNRLHQWHSFRLLNFDSQGTSYSRSRQV